MFTEESFTKRTCKFTGILVLLAVLTFIFALLISRFFGDQFEPAPEVEQQDVTLTDNV
jgi:vacuolar-type H+-ATPase subunit I/STV1